MSPLQSARAWARWLVLHERAQIAVKAAVAAGVSWWAAEAVAGFLPRAHLLDYRYYAPLGALVATYATVAHSIRQSVSAVASIAAGGAVGLTVHTFVDGKVLALAVVVAAGVGVGGLPWLGGNRSLVPVVGMFTLVVGGSDPTEYVAAYVGLAMLGALIAIAVTAAVPALRLSQGHASLRAVEEVLADQLADLADGLRQHEPPGQEEWERRLWTFRPKVEQMRASMEEAGDAQRANPRARRHGYEADRQQQMARALERVSVLVEDLVEILTDTYRQDLPSTPLDPELAAATAEALDRLAAVVRRYHAPMSAQDELLVRGREALNRLIALFSDRRDLDASELAVLGAVVANLRRCLSAVSPRTTPS